MRIVKRGYTLSVNLSRAEVDSLRRLQERYHLNQSDVIRKLLYMANNPRYRLPDAVGAPHGQDVAFPQELNDEDFADGE